MTLIIFKYCLPILLGYVLFAGITDRYFPFFRPKNLRQRPRWFLGLWSGAAIAILGVVGLDIAYKTAVSDLPTLVTPVLLATAIALLPGLVGYVYYRMSVKRQLSEHSDTPEIDVTDHTPSAHSEQQLETQPEPTEIEAAEDLFTSPVVEADDQYSRWAENLNHDFGDQAELDDTQLFEVDLIPTGEPAFFDQEDAPEALELNELDADETLVLTSMDTDATLKYPYIDNRTELELAALEADKTLRIDAIDVDATLELPKFDADATLELPKRDTQFADNTNLVEHSELNRLRDELTSEIKFRQEIETHLRITRKGLSQLEIENRAIESEKSAAQARADREEQRRVSLEQEIALIREDAVKSSSESQESSEARAKALSTASKATSIACKAMQARTQLEEQLLDAQMELDRSKVAIRDLKLALELERQRAGTAVQVPLATVNG